MRTERYGERQLRHVEFDLDLADADFADEGMVAGIAALGGIAERQQKTLVAACQRLQADVARHREFQRLAGDVAGDMVLRHVAIRLDQAFAGEDVGDARHGVRLAGALQRLGDVAAGGKLGIEQAVGVVEGRAEQLAAGQILVGRRDAPLDQHRAGVDRPGVAEARQRRAIGANQEDRLDHVAARLNDGQRRQFPVVERAFAHHAVDGERQLLDDLVEANRRHGAVAAAAVGEQGVGVGDGGFAAFDGDIHVTPPSS